VARLPTAPLTQNTITPPVEEYSQGVLEVTPSTFALNLTLQIPVITIEYNNPGSFPLTLMLENSTVANQADPGAPQALTLTLHAPTVQVDAVETPAAFSLTLTLIAPALTIDSQASAPLFALTLTGPNMLSPTLGYLNTQIRKYIKDPVVTSGCAQCGTLLWDVHPNAIRIDSERVSGGLNYDKDGGRPDDRYVRCARCGWINNQNQRQSHPEGSRAGWGINEEQLEVIPNEPADDWRTNRQPTPPGTILPP